jgi:hypothetical protein
MIAMTETLHRLAIALLVPLLLAATAMVASAADVVVLESSVHGIKTGDELANERNLKIEFGQHLLVSLQQGGRIKQQEIRGPREGTVQQLLRPEPVSRRIWRIVVLLAQSGGATQTEPAAGRGALLLVDQTPVLGAATVCVESSHRPQFGLASDAEKPFTFQVYEGSAIRGNSITLTKASPQAAWPAQAVIRDGSLYRLVGSELTVDLTLRVLPAGTLARLPQVATLDEFDRLGCWAQVELALRQAISGRG